MVYCIFLNKNLLILNRICQMAYYIFHILITTLPILKSSNSGKMFKASSILVVLAILVLKIKLLSTLIPTDLLPTNQIKKKHHYGNQTNSDFKFFTRTNLIFRCTKVIYSVNSGQISCLV